MNKISVFLSVDGGGTKLAALLFNEEMHVLSHAMGASVNTNFETLDAVERHMRGCLKECLAPWLDAHPGQFPTAAYAAIVGPIVLFAQVLNDIAPGCRLFPINEGMMLCLSGRLSTNGIVVLSGTGSGVVLCKDGVIHTHLGGWGSLIGDEGSGYAIGRDGIAAVIRANDCWGEHTAMTDLLYKQFNLSNLHDIIPGIYSASNPRAVIASAAPLVGQAASAGDAVARKIYDTAAAMLAKQLGGLLRKTNMHPGTVPVVACGGAWNSYISFIDIFADKVRREYPEIQISRAKCRIEAGGAVRYLLDCDPGRTPDDIERLLSPGFFQFKT